MKREKSYVLVGEKRDGIWLARLRWPTRGTPTTVEFDWEKALAREENRGDVVGFLHTHPEFEPIPSGRDRRTMRGWCTCFGKPLLCVIANGDDVRGWLYPGESAIPVTRFRGGWLVATE